MATHTFYKYQGEGNDFIVFDDRKALFEKDNVELVRRLCDRRFGIGADGLMLLRDTEGHDFEMIYFNADGREGSMCGNGGRCIVAFAQDLGLIGVKTDFMAVDGVHHAQVLDDSPRWVSLQMNDVDTVERSGDAYVLNTGSPHYVQWLADQTLSDFPVVEQGREIRYGPTYHKEGINVNFVASEGAGYFLRTYERGVEDETLACGTGAVATAMAMALREGTDGAFTVPIRVAGGNLRIRFNKQGDRFTQVFLEGPATFVFKGEIIL